MRLADLLANISYASTDFENVKVSDLVYDPRKVVPGCAFICLKGVSADGHDFAEQAAKQGASVLIVQDDVAITKKIPIIRVENTRQALAMMSAAFFGYPAKEIAVIGLTGTKGKTTTAYMIRAILEQAGIRTGLIGTVGVLIGETVFKTSNTTPESYEMQKYLRKMIDMGCKSAVVEASSIGLREHRTAGMEFAVGVFTNFSEDHIGGVEHKDMEEYLACKSMLFGQCRYGAINCDDTVWKQVIQGNTCEKITTFGFTDGADYRASGERLISRSGYLGVHFELSGKQNLELDVAIPGKFSVYNALAAITACSYFNIQPEHICCALDMVKVKGRVEIMPVDGPYTLLIDYAHNAASMESILNTLREYQPNRLICMFGAGGDRSKSRRFEVGETCGRLADLSIVTADNSRFEPVLDIIADIRVGLEKTNGKYVVIPDRREAIAYCMEHAQEGDIVVLAGKGHEDYQEIEGIKYPFDEHVIVAELNSKMRLA